LGVQLVLALATLGAQPARAQEPDERLYVGRTGIMCTRLPCPHRGIYPPDARGVRARLRYADVDGQTPLPTLTGAPADQARVRAAWDERGCVEIEGRLDPQATPPTLRVARVVGECG
jgi:hypothetical protein